MSEVSIGKAFVCKAGPFSWGLERSVLVPDLWGIAQISTVLSLFIPWEEYASLGYCKDEEITYSYISH